ncbi:hypothetical protein DYH55_16755 [Methylovirgula sp. 4M-Z18]|nr:hypothetical protein DYH55_16755 [Methylovirgula sp. 4M-Z18]
MKIRTMAATLLCGCVIGIVGPALTHTVGTEPAGLAAAMVLELARRGRELLMWFLPRALPGPINMAIASTVLNADRWAVRGAPM